MGASSASLSTHGFARFTLGHWPFRAWVIVRCGRSRSLWTVRPSRKSHHFQIEMVDGSTDVRRTQVYPHACSWPQAICEFLLITCNWAYMIC